MTASASMSQFNDASQGSDFMSLLPLTEDSIQEITDTESSGLEPTEEIFVSGPRMTATPTPTTGTAIPPCCVRV